MPAPKGNQFWKNADPDCFGRPRIFPKPEDLWEEAKKYFDECDNSPLETHETTVTSDKEIYKTVQHRIPYTWEGLYVSLGVCHLDRYKEKEDFAGIITHIGNIIRNQKYSGAAAGIFNANIIARDLGLVNKTEESGSKEVKINLSKEALKAISDKLDDLI